MEDTQGADYAVRADGGACDDDKKHCEFHGAKLKWQLDEPIYYIMMGACFAFFLCSLFARRGVSSDQVGC